MRIGVDIRSLMDNQFSGVPEYTFNLLGELLKIDTKNEYVLFYNSGKNISDKMSVFISKNSSIFASRFPNLIFNVGMQKILGFPKIDSKMNVDLFFAPNLGFISLSKKVKKVITIHDLSFLRFPDYFSWRRRLWHQAVNVQEMIKKFDVVVAVSQRTKTDIIELTQIAPEKIVVIYSGVGEEFRLKSERLDGEISEIKKKYDLPKRFIFSLSTIEPRKNINGLIEAFNLLMDSNFDPELELVIAGASGWKQKSIFESWHKSKYQDKIRFIGYVEKSEKKAFYSLAEVFLYISFYEGFGFPPLEAINSGCPVILGANSCLPEIAGSSSILVNPFKISQVSLAVRSVLENNRLKELLKKKEETNSNYIWQKTALEYLTIFNSLV